MCKHGFLKYVIGLLWLVLSPGVVSYETKLDNNEQECQHARRYTFSWLMHAECGELIPRGGTSKGSTVTLDPMPHEGWLALQEPGLSKFEQDRRAILAMAGPYRTSFDFLEVLGFSPDFKPDSPYQSWGTEYVYVVENRDDFISLQHIMVMYFEHDGKISGPMVMKHWRQDWQYQKRVLNQYAGNNSWKKNKVTRKSAKGAWAQAVYQVDDSPRYEALGRWVHNANVSTWISDTSWRPLPRREHSVRDDYQVLEGTNRHTIIPTGWVHEQENYKLVLDSEGRIAKEMPYLSKELGLNRYEKIIDHDFSAGDNYWQRTGEYWKDVRLVWRDILLKNNAFRLRKTVDKTPLFMPMFSYADKLMKEPYDSKEGKLYIRKTIEQYIH